MFFFYHFEKWEYGVFSMAVTYRSQNSFQEANKLKSYQDVEDPNV